MRNLGQDDALAWLLIPVLGLMISAAMLTAIVYALTPDEKWDARHNPGTPWSGDRLGGGAGGHRRAAGGRRGLMGTVAYSGQKFFEWELSAARARRPRATGRLEDPGARARRTAPR
jgi:hypothetical protein